MARQQDPGYKPLPVWDKWKLNRAIHALRSPFHSVRVAAHREIQKILAMDKDRLSLNNFLRRKYLKLYLQFLKTRKSPVKCQSFASTCFLDPYGNLFPCAVYNRKLLNIKETVLSLNEIWQLKEALRIHNECARNKCPSCWSPCDAYSAMGGSIIPTVFK